MMDHFRVLPTDPKIQSLNLDLIGLLFTYSTISLSDQERMQLFRNQLKDKEDEDLEKFMDLGYQGEELDEILRGIKDLKTK